MIPSISAVVHTLNEERNLPFALRSLRSWVDEIVVVDMESDDGTADVAKTFGARVVSHERVGFADPAREFGCAQTTGDWILILDADEILPEPLSRRLREIAAGDEADVVRIPRINYLLGSRLKHTGWNEERDRHIRFFKRGMYRPSAFVHQHGFAGAGARVLDLPAGRDFGIVHFNCLDSSHFLDKLNAYTTIEAAEKDARHEKPSAARALVWASREWLARYVRHGGFKDGWRGFTLSIFMAAYPIVVYAKGRELLDLGSRDDVMRRYREEAERFLVAYRPSNKRESR